MANVKLHALWLLNCSWFRGPI